VPGARGAGMSDHRGMIDRQQGHSTCMFRSSTGKICPYSVFPIRALPTYRYDLRDRPDKTPISGRIRTLREHSCAAPRGHSLESSRGRRF